LVHRKIRGIFEPRRPARPDAVAAGSDSPFVRTPVPFSPRTRATAAAAAAGLAHNAVRTGDHHTNHARRRRQVCQLRLKRWCPVPVGVLPCRHHRQRALRHGVPGASKSSPARSVAERSVAASDSGSAPHVSITVLELAKSVCLSVCLLSDSYLTGCWLRGGRERTVSPPARCSSRQQKNTAAAAAAAVWMAMTMPGGRRF
jgi:hypothetical protein